MSRALFTGSFILIMVWAIAFLGLHKGGVIHILPAIAVIVLIFRLLYNKTETPQ